MSSVYLLSIIVQGTALAWSLELVRRYRDWRLAFLSLTLTLMFVWRWCLLLAKEGARLDSFGVEWPSLIISAMSLVAVFFLSSLLQELQRIRRSNERTVAELAEHERRLRTIIETEPECVKLLGPDGALLEMNRAGLRMIEVDSLDQVRGRSVLDLVLPQYRQSFSELTDRVLRGDSGTLEFEIEGLHGTRRWLETHATPYRDASGQIISLLGITRDITERKRAERLIESQRAELQLILDSVPALVFCKDDQGRLVRVNDQLAELVGYTKEEMVGKTDAELGSPHAERYLAEDRQVIATGRPFHRQLELLHTTRGERWIETDKIPQHDESGRVVGVIGFAIDVTERRRAEGALRESERFARATLDALSANIAILDENGVIIGVNRAWRDFASANSASLAAVCEGSNYLLACGGTSEAGQETTPSFATGVRAVIEGSQDEFTLEYPCHSPTEKRWFVGRVTRFPGDGPRRIVVAHENITQRKLVEQALLESRTLLEQAQRIARLGAWVSGPGSSDSLWWSDQTYEIFGLSREQFDGSVHSFFDSIYLDDRPAVQEVSRAALAGEQPYEIEHRIILPDGTIRWVHELAEVIRNADGSASQMIGVVRDITARREADEALRASQSMLELVLDSIPQGVFWKDRNSIYLGANRVSREASGLGMSESVVGLTDFQLPSPTPEEAEYFTLKDREVMDSNQPQFGIEETLTRSDGSAIWLETNKVPMRDPDGHVIGILGTWQDITKRKQTDNELRASRERLQALSRQLLNAQEAERRHIARELHDQIGQSLTAIKLNLKSLRPPDYETSAMTILQETITVVDQTLEQVRTLSLDLRPSMLDDLGLVSALRWYLDRQAKRAGFSVQFAAESSDSGVSKEVETTCFRVTQEIVTNIARHAHARNVRVELHQLDTELELFIQDDGVGFDPTAARERAARGSSMGLLGMQERVMIVGGQMDIQSVPSRGTEVRVRFPLMFAEPDELKD